MVQDPFTLSGFAGKNNSPESLLLIPQLSFLFQSSFTQHCLSSLEDFAIFQVILWAQSRASQFLQVPSSGFP